MPDAADRDVFVALRAKRDKWWFYGLKNP
jgi:hypothetical protein